MAATSCTAGPPDPTPWIGVFGILSIDGHVRQRRAIRRSWLPAGATSQMLARFVIRSIGASDETLAELRQHGDGVLLPVSSALGRAAGPMQSLMLWLQCALATWPRAMTIGKADDDVWVHLEGVAAHLTASARDVVRRGRSPGQMVWGVMETYHWDVEKHRPRAFHPGYGFNDNNHDCWRRPSPHRRNERAAHGGAWRSPRGRRRGLFIGPFHFPKGPLFFLSRGLVAQLVADDGVRVEAAAAVASVINQSDATSANLSSPENYVPWEDAFVGLALAQAANGSGLTAVDIGGTLTDLGAYTEPWTHHLRADALGLAPSTLVFHDTNKRPSRLVQAQRWAKQHHCHPKEQQLSCLAPWTACNGARWLRCRATRATYAASGCGTTIKQLSGGFRPQRTDAHLEECSRSSAAEGGAPLVGQSSGYCAVTEFGADCASDESGAWKAASLDKCVALCRCCARCSYVSFTAAGGECSWYAACEIAGLTRRGDWTTVKVK